jgi:hypothetical protein
MERKRVNSSKIRAIGYDPSTAPRRYRNMMKGRVRLQG